MTVKKENTTQYCKNKLANAGQVHTLPSSLPSWQTHSQPLRVVILVIGEESIQRIVAGDDKASKVGEELATEVEDDEEKVQGGQAHDSVGLGDTGALLNVV